MKKRLPDSRWWCGLALACLLAAARINTFAQDQPIPQPAQQPEKPALAGPVQSSKKPNSKQTGAAADKTKAATIEAAKATKKLGEATLDRMRDWESGWFTGPYVGRDRPLALLTGEQRRQIYLQQTLTTPSAYFKRMMAAGIDQWRESPPEWNEHWSGYGERFASREGQFIAANSLAALGNAALKYEPRYDQCRCSGFWPRTRHAVARNFLTYNQSEQEMRPQWALYGGAFGGGLISTAWKPHPRNAFAEGGRAVLGQAAYGALLNFLIEFAGDINRKLGAQKR